MREIKFRGKKEEMNSLWTYGSLVICDNGDYQIGSCRKYGDIYYRSKVYLETVGQYTNLKDKNGEEIYEGDIIEFSYDVFNGKFDTKIGKGVIEFIAGAFQIKTIEIEDNTECFILYSVNEDALRVIGNIYDDKELLEG